MKNQTFECLSELPGGENAMLACKLHACHHGLLVESTDGKVARFGYRVKANYESVKHLENMEPPEGMSGIVKISAGKFAQVALTEDGRLWGHGYSRYYSLGV